MRENSNTVEQQPLHGNSGSQREKRGICLQQGKGKEASDEILLVQG